MKILFHKGKSADTDTGDTDDLVQELKKKRDYLHGLSSDHLIEFFDEAGTLWKRDTELAHSVGGSLKHLANFLRKENTVPMLDFALRGDHRILDRFIDHGNTQYLYHCQPRGLAVHWLSGNVPFLGLYALVQTILTKNPSLLKASGKSYRELLLLLESLAHVNTPHVRGSELLETLAVVLVDSSDRKMQEELSLSADIRIAWGGGDAIQEILSLPKQFFCEDIIYGPKYSFGVIDRASCADYRQIAKRLAFDVCTLDQYACSSPHTVFLEESDKVSIEVFAQTLADEIDLVTAKVLPKKEDDAKKKNEIRALRAKYHMLGTVYASGNTDWTVIVSREEGLAPATFSRVIHVRPIRDVARVGEYVDRKKQTLGCAFMAENREALVDRITRDGIDRCVSFGDMTLYESPWDGFFGIDRMVRWVSLNKHEDK